MDSLDWLAPTGLHICRVEVPRAGDGRVDLLALAGTGAGLLFESAGGVPRSGSWSMVAIETAGELVHDGVSTWLSGPDGVQDLGPDPFDAIDRVTAALHATPDDLLPPGGPPFVGGLAGAFAYDLCRVAEELPTVAAADRAAPWLDLLVVTELVAVDHRTETAWHVRRPLGRSAPRRPPGVLAPPHRHETHRRVTSTLSSADYRRAIAIVLDHIAAGEVFQVNLAQRLTSRWTRGPVELYRRLLETSPAPHAALFRRDDTNAIVSISPETFLQARGRHITTRPIKGTRARQHDPHADQQAGEELRNCPKDQAENVMVVDVERNDLGRVCRPGTVRTTALLVPRAHPTVWQLESTITGQLRPHTGWGALLRASFPSGSITGAPKIRAMELIEQLEPVRRSWYCGSLGWLGPGSASLSVAIRTAVLSEDRVDYAAGGGIVADSTPDAEIAESWTKASAFLTAIDAHGDGAYVHE